MDSYYKWLISIVGDRNGVLLQTLYSIPYRYDIPMDENRYNAGMNQRSLYAYQEGVYLADVTDRPVSVLEVLVSVSKAMDENTSIPKEIWFWEMMSNMHLTFSENQNYITKTINDWMDHKYSYVGVGSPFPLKTSSVDTRNLQLWDLMGMYINEKCGEVRYLN